VKPRKILWVEDDANVLMGLVRPLEKDGHKIIIAEDEIDALELINENNFDLILVDIIIPTGKKDDYGHTEFVGFDLLKKIKELEIEVPIIVLSVIRDPNMIKEMYEIGVKLVLPKGAYLPSKLKEQVYEVLGVDK